MNPAMFDRLTATLDGLVKRDAQRETEHRALVKAIEGLTRAAQPTDSDWHTEIRHDMTTTAVETLDLTSMTGGYPVRDVRVLALGTGTLQVRTPDMLDWLTVAATGILFENDNLQQLQIRESAGGGSGVARFRLGAWTGRE